MNSKKTIFIAVFWVVAFCSTALVGAMQMVPKNADTLDHISQNLAVSARALFDEGNSDVSLQSDNIMGSIGDKEISRNYFAQRVNLYKACGSEDAAEDAWNSIIKEVCEYKFAETHNLLPDTTEVQDRCREMRLVIEADPETHQSIRYLLENMGFTEDEYWEIYKPMYEMPAQIIKERIYAYQQQNNLPELDYTSMDAEIWDQEFFDSF